MRCDLFTLFPEFFASPLQSSILGRAQAAGMLQIATHNIRDWATDKHRRCDDYPYGGGAGMVMKAEPVAQALSAVLKWEFGPDDSIPEPPCPILLMSPQGRPFNAKLARHFAGFEHLAIVCAHYEGLDERAVQTLITDEISIGDYVLTGGEAAALVVIDAIARFVPEVLGNELSAGSDSFENGMLEAPHYTRPANWRGQEVPDVLLSGNHAEIAAWRARQSLQRTTQRRPDLLGELDKNL